MKASIAIIYALLGLSCASCQEKSAIKLSLSVTDDAGSPVSQASIETDVFDHWKPGEGFGKDIFKRITVVTDKAGIATLEVASARCDLVFSATKIGYYQGKADFKSTIRADGRWQPWNKRLEIRLNRVLQPIPLMAKLVADETRQHIPMPNERAAYDLEVGDWVAPHGKGRISDLKFELKGGTKDASVPYDSTMTLAFSHPGDGIIVQESGVFPPSALRMPYSAPAAGYLPEITWRKARLAGAATGIDRIIDETKPTQNYFLRLRTVLNEKGEIVSAHYAKVCRGFTWYASGYIKFQYHFNPAANNRNLEFDLKRNLLKVNPGQAVIDP